MLLITHKLLLQCQAQLQFLKDRNSKSSATRVSYQYSRGLYLQDSLGSFRSARELSTRDVPHLLTRGNADYTPLSLVQSSSPEIRYGPSIGRVNTPKYVTGGNLKASLSTVHVKTIAATTSSLFPLCFQPFHNQHDCASQHLNGASRLRAPL